MEQDSSQYSIELINPDGLRPSVSEFADASEREGVFAHTFKCMDCSLEFAIFSWWSDRHTVTNTACPECCAVTQKSHWMSVISDRREMSFDRAHPEIFDLSPVGRDARIQADCSIFTGLPSPGVDYD